MSSSDDKNSLNDVQNVLGFLLAGFGGILSFIGLRSSEVTTVLRNDSLRASLIAVLLLLAVLAAVVAVATPIDSTIPTLRVIAISISILGIGALVIAAVPIQEPSVLGVIAGLILFMIAIYVWISVPDDWKTEQPGYHTVRTQLAFIIASVILLSCSVYGAIRLETRSQLSSEVQVGASITQGSDGMVLSVHVTGSKITNSGYVGISVLGVPTGTDVVRDCKPVKLLPSAARCASDPCAYLKAQCVVVMGETVAPDASGDIDETLTDGIVPGKFEEIHVQTVICSSSQGVCRSVRQSGSRLDFQLTNFPGVLSH